MTPRIRTKMVATEASYVPVSLLCEPWNQPREPRLEKPKTTPVDRSNPEAKVLAAIQSGKVVFDHIMMEAFGTRNGRTDKEGRQALRNLLNQGKVERVKALHINGQPYLWSIK